MAGSTFIDAVIGVFGFGRVVLGDWPAAGNMKSAIRQIEDAGGIREDSYGTPDGQCDCVRFRFRRRRIRLCEEEMGEVTLFGPKQLIFELSQQIRHQLNDRDRSDHPTVA